MILWQRLAKIFSVVRLFKVAKVLKIFMANKKRHEQEIVDAGVDTDGDIDVKMSIVGRKMIDSITKKGMSKVYHVSCRNSSQPHIVHKTTHP